MRHKKRVLLVHWKTGQVLVVLLMCSLLLTSCTFTISPLGDISFEKEHQEATTQEPVVTTSPQVVTTPGASSTVPDATSTPEPEVPAVTKTVGWAILGKSAEDVGLTLHYAIDYVIAGRTLDKSFYDPDTQTGALVDQLQKYGTSPQDVRLDYALINVGTNTATTSTWTLYHFQPLTAIVTPTYVVPYSTIQTGIPYTLSKELPLNGGNTAGASSSNCGANLREGIICLRQQVGPVPGGNVLLSHPAAFLLLSSKTTMVPKYFLAWFWIMPSGQPLSPPDDSGGICQFCTTVCNGGWCDWVCQTIRC